jgi:hypothetical protein
VADVQADGAAAEVALALGPLGRTELPGGVQGGEEFAINAAAGRIARLAAGDQLQAQAACGGRHLIQERSPLLRAELIEGDARGREAAGHLSVSGHEGGVNGGHSGAGEGLGEGTEQVEVDVAGARRAQARPPCKAGGDEREIGRAHV